MTENAYGQVMKKIFLSLLMIGFLNGQSYSQTGQISIPRVTQMPGLPSPYIMRDWKAVATRYDELVFSTSATGQYLPLVHFKPTGINYLTLQPILLDSYVGAANSGNQAEAINIIPALVGATLVGADKSDQNGVNWPLQSKDFFNQANGQNVYLNGYSAISGGDGWYDLMPNVFFYQLYTLYPNVPDFNVQFTTVADRWLDAVYAMGGSTTPWTIPDMNFRGWKLEDMTPNRNGVMEPETAGTIAWLLYHAWIHTGDKKYLTGAQLSMDFLSNLDSNPAYELQLPYGAFVAAKMNAELGTHYDLEKIVNWCFDRGPLRGWGVIAGKWNGSDVSGLIGEANDGGDDYAFVMNGFQQAAALVPMVKYDKRFARDIAKWTLNLANASRLFYPQYLPPADQDDHSWSEQHDPQSVIAYEALKENWNGKKLYGTGDAKRSGWAQTNLGIYGSSHVGYLGAIVESTDVEGILKLDVNKTDFFGKNPFPSYLVYNPHTDSRQVMLLLGPQTLDVYDAISETVIETSVTGNTPVDVAGGQVMLLVYLPSGALLEEKQGKLFLGDEIVDHHYGYHFEGKVRIKSLAVSDTLVEFKQPVRVYSAIENAAGPVTYDWYVNGTTTGSSMDPDFTWTAPEAEGHYTLKLKVTAAGDSSQDSLVFRVVQNIPKPPEVTGLKTDSAWYYSGTTATVICAVVPDTGNSFQYTWTLPGGSVISQKDSLIRWSLPQAEGLFPVSCEVTNTEGLKTTAVVNVLVKKRSEGTTAPFAYYPLDGNTRDYSGNGHDATRQGGQLTADARGEPGKAYRFSSGSDIIFVPNETSLNFRDQITISFWVKLDAVTQESFILSHGSWEERWKVSVTPDKKLRWTIKTSSGTTDLDSSFPLQLDRFYHFAVVYSGYSMELYADGELDSYLSNSGLMSVTGKALTFGRKDTDVAEYFLKGSLDEVRIYNRALSPDEIGPLMSLWNDQITGVGEEIGEGVMVYPNPSNGMINISAGEKVTRVEVLDLRGRKVFDTHPYGDGSLIQFKIDRTPGMFILQIETSGRVFYRKIRIE